ncbi:hypothetical protein OPV22_010651 [Ensete ventricosum]|uniref:Uncharacterized protein n=1 Tax=Ensete ventricosum TaxID=4639 RepID=A0AAV8RJK4_ENSVE|nr:hypothetical protein OPV22_010651 [Ensete ventricosum]
MRKITQAAVSPARASATILPPLAHLRRWALRVEMSLYSWSEVAWLEHRRDAGRRGMAGGAAAISSSSRWLRGAEEKDLEVKLRRIMTNVPVPVSNTSGNSAGSGSGDFHQHLLPVAFRRCL